jgi:hypothetical protein
MRRCLAFLAVAFLWATVSARADWMLIKIDMSLIYKNPPTTPGTGPGPGPAPVVPPPPPVIPMKGKGIPIQPKFPVPVPQPVPMPGAAGQPPVFPPGDGPFVYAIIEIKDKSKPKEKAIEEKGIPDFGKAYIFDHPLGKGARMLEMAGWSPNVVKYTTITQKGSLAKSFERQWKTELATSKDAAKFLEAARWALAHGLKDEFHNTMGEYRKLAPKSPEAVNYTRVNDGLREPPKANDPLFNVVWNDLGGSHGFRLDAKGHYVALTDLPINTFDKEIRERLDVLERNLENFYYWFALHPQLSQPALPTHRQGVMLLKDSGEFYAKHAQFGSPPFAGDAFTPRRDNFIVASSEHLNEIYRHFKRKNMEQRNELIKMGYNATLFDFISGNVWDKGNEAFDQFRRAYVQTLTITEKLFDDQLIRSTYSREGTRQLLFESGLLPRHVHTPEWIAQGLAGYFETPMGAPYVSVGLPSWNQVVNLKYLRVQSKLEKPGDVLRKVITDQYFRSSHRLFADLNDASDKEKINGRIRDEFDAARGTAWSLIYYLIERERTPELVIRYCRELDSLPRDLDLDDRALEACFAKVFNLGEARNPLRLDNDKLNAFAERWFQNMAGVSLELPDLQNEYMTIRRSTKPSAGLN